MSVAAPAYLVSELSGGQPRRWTREEYHRAADLGLFGPDERLELIGGEVIEKLTQKPPHTRGVFKTARTLNLAFGPGCMVRQQMPIALAEDGEPEPDILVVRGDPDDFESHPTQADALLIVEVSDRTLRYDLGRKAAYYAEAGIADYWVLDLVNRRLRVHRDPIADSSSPYRFRYTTIVGVEETEAISPLALPGEMIHVANLLPL